MSDPDIRLTFTKIANARAASHAPKVKMVIQKNIFALFNEDKATPDKNAKDRSAASSDNKHINKWCRCNIRVIRERLVTNKKIEINISLKGISHRWFTRPMLYRLSYLDIKKQECLDLILPKYIFL